MTRDVLAVAPEDTLGEAAQKMVERGVGSAVRTDFGRPIARAHLRMPSQLRTGTAALVGARGVAVERIDAHGGRVKIGGEIWTARAFDEAQVIEPGARVEIVKIEGATALVYE